MSVGQIVEEQWQEFLSIWMCCQGALELMSCHTVDYRSPSVRCCCCSWHLFRINFFILSLTAPSRKSSGLFTLDRVEALGFCLKWASKMRARLWVKLWEKSGVSTCIKLLAISARNRGIFVIYCRDSRTTLESWHRSHTYMNARVWPETKRPTRRWAGIWERELTLTREKCMTLPSAKPCFGRVRVYSSSDDANWKLNKRET
jgi:hypothetical protein